MRKLISTIFQWIFFVIGTVGAAIFFLLTFGLWKTRGQKRRKSDRKF